MTTLTLPTTERESRQMELRGVRVHNLKNIDVDIPLGKLVVLSGVSGSGKSSLAFDTLFAEGQRRYIESFSVSARQHLERIDRPDADRIAHVPLAIAIRSDHTRRQRSEARSTVAIIADLLDGLRMLFSRAGHIICPECQVEVRSHSTLDVVRAISSLPPGTRCQLGFALTELEERPSPAAWLARGFARAIWGGVTQDLSTQPNWPVSEKPWIVSDRIVVGKASEERLLESAEAAFREGNGRCGLLVEVPSAATVLPGAEMTRSNSEKVSVVDGRNWSSLQFHRSLSCSSCGKAFLPLEPRLFSHLSSGACLTCRGTGRTAIDNPESVPCPACTGTRYREEARAVKIAGRSIADICRLSSSELVPVLETLFDLLSPAELETTSLIREEISSRLHTVIQLGLGYFTLDREASTLSGGETRRLMLAATIGARITGTLVVIDEPSAGLSEAELPLLIAALGRLRELRNSVVVVEHSPHIVLAADHVIELGPAAGPGGGTIVYEGPPRTLPTEPTVEGPSNSSPVRKSSSAKVRSLRLSKINHHNLKQFRAEFPLGRMTVVAGRGGSGKTSLISQVLFPTVCRRLGLVSGINDPGACELEGGEELVEAVLIDPLPLTRSSRSNPATWLEVFDEIRQTFAATTDARQRGFTSQSFSFNSTQGGRCRSCLGTGLLKQDMNFLPDVTLPCPECGGTRYRREILEVKYRGRSIADVLSMSVSEAASFFRSQPRVQYRFQLLKQIGLDYLSLGQPSETLSGGEAQRLKLAARLAMPNRGPTLIVCDEPTTGLHPSDVIRLIACFRELIANGHTLVLADNSPELISAADHVIRLESI